MMLKLVIVKKVQVSDTTGDAMKNNADTHKMNF